MSIQNMPKRPVVHLDEAAPRPKRSEPVTFRRVFTGDDSRSYLVGYLRDLSNKKGPWREYYEFFCANQSGDMSSMTSQNRKYAEKIVEEVLKKYDDEMSG